jgi:predicted nucleic-acid-binding Zn-ribbon protein
MSDVKKCPKCNGEMEVGYLTGAPYWKRGRRFWGSGMDSKVFAYKCRTCGYTEFYCEALAKDKNAKWLDLGLR